MIYKNIDLKGLGHSGFLIKSELGNIYIDPFKLQDEEGEEGEEEDWEEEEW
jgi:L-ascorbate metabolism protein UlaG (beta-lactamase superfamily)